MTISSFFSSVVQSTTSSYSHLLTTNHRYLVLLVVVLPILILSVTLLFYPLINALLLDPLRKVPGPFWARFSRLWYLGRILEGRFEKVNIDLHRKYGEYRRYLLFLWPVCQLLNLLLSWKNFTSTLI